jgi:hypothetical protein
MEVVTTVHTTDCLGTDQVTYWHVTYVRPGAVFVRSNESADLDHWKNCDRRFQFSFKDGFMLVFVFICLGRGLALAQLSCLGRGLTMAQFPLNESFKLSKYNNSLINSGFSSVTRMTRLHNGQPRNRGSVSGWGRYLSLLRSVQTCCGARASSYAASASSYFSPLLHELQCEGGHSPLMPRLIMSGVVQPLPHTSSWHGS